MKIDKEYVEGNDLVMEVTLTGGSLYLFMYQMLVSNNDYKLTVEDITGDNYR